MLLLCGCYVDVREKTAIFGQKTPILALLDPFFEENFRQFSVNGEGVPPLSAKVFLAK